MVTQYARWLMHWRWLVMLATLIVVGFTSVNITVQLPGKSLTEVPEVANFAQNLTDELQARDANLRVDLTGIAMMNNTFSTEAEGDMATLIPIMFLIIIVTIGLMLRSIVPVIVTLLVIILSIVMSMNFTDVPPLAHLGNTVAVGVAAAWLLSMTFLPALAVVLPIKARKTENNQHPFFDFLSNFVIKQRKAILWFFGIANA